MTRTQLDPGIEANVRALDTLVLRLAHDTKVATEDLGNGEINAAVGSVVALEPMLQSALAMCTAIKEMQRLRLSGTFNQSA